MEQVPSSANQQSEDSPSLAGPSEEPTRPATAKRKVGKTRARTDNNGEEQRTGMPEPEYLNLGEAHEDVIDAASEPAPATETIQPLPPDAAPTSQLSEKVYIQEVAGFRKAGRQQYENSLADLKKQVAAETGDVDGSYVHTTAGAIQTGIAGQTVFRTLAVTLQGILAGFSIAHCLMVVFDTPPYFSNSHFINHYALLALPAHCLYYVTLVIVTLAALDRYDIGQSFLRVVYRAVTFQSGGLAVVCYLAATVINQLPISVEERMTLYYRNVTVATVAASDRFPVTEQPWMEGDLQLWRGCLIAKAVLVTVAWMLVAVRPSTDLLAKHLRQADAEFAQEFEMAKTSTATNVETVDTKV